MLQRLKTPRGLSLFQGKCSQKVKKVISFRLFESFNFFDFSTFRAEIPWNVNFSTFRLSAGENRDFHGVTATSQKSTQRKLTHTQIEPSRPTHQPLPPASSPMVPVPLPAPVQQLVPSVLLSRDSDLARAIAHAGDAPQWTIPNLGWFFTVMFYSIFLTKNNEVINQVIFIHPKFSKSNLPNI